MTDAETILWQHLRANRLSGLHFRRQQVIRGFIVDFYCHAAGIVVEVDGDAHTHQEAYDHERDQILASHGIRILRISNDAVIHSLEDVLASIQAICQAELGSSA
jgi:very-short-patch-repair endonuclease